MSGWFLYTVLLIVALRGAFSRPAWVVAAAAFFIPLSQRMPSPFGIISVPANVIVLALLIAVMRNREREDQRVALPLRVLILMFSTFILVGMAHRWYLESVAGKRYLNELSFVFMLCKDWLMPFVTYALVFRLVDSLQTLRLAWFSALACCAGESLLALYERLQGVARATAHLDEANMAGGFFAASCMLFLSTALILSGWMRWACAAGACLSTGAVFATLSRGGMLATAAGMLMVVLVFYVFVRGRASKLGLAVIIALIGLNGTLLLPGRVQERILSTFQGGSSRSEELGLDTEVDQSAGERLALWQTSLRLMSESPMGSGFYTFNTEVGRYFALHKASHNVYLQVGTELGVAALAVLAVLVASVWIKAWRVFRAARSTWQECIGLGLIGAWTSMAVAVFFMNALFAFNFCGQFWTLLAAGLRVVGLEGRADEEAARREPVGRPIPGAGRAASGKAWTGA